MMGIVNYTVYCLSKRKTVVPWTIAAVHPPSSTFRSFFAAQVQSQCVDCTFSQAFTGQTKESLDPVDPDLVVNDVIQVFGPYLKYAVEQSDRGVTDTETSCKMGRNAFEVIMSAQRQKCMPDMIADPKNSKQRLFNSVITFLTERKCKWRNSDVSLTGMNLVTALTDTLWAIDGHHHVFENQGQHIPHIFGKFVGYNKPELHKHRKRQVSNMSSSVLHSLSDHLFHCLQGNYWNKGEWVNIKVDVEALAECLSKYTEYLDASKKKTKLNQCFASPVRELSEHLNFHFLPISTSSSSSLVELQTHLESAPNFQYISVEDVCCFGSSKLKYDFMKTVKSTGFPFPTALLIYTHGNNIGNLNFVWKVQSANESSFSESQATIEAVKGHIPVFHTRAMRKEMFMVFGRVTSSVKPAVIRHIYRLFTGDASAASTLSEAEVDERVKRFIDMEDPDVIMDLRELQTGRRTKFDFFWEECRKYLQECVGLAVDERRHSQVTHIASAISVRDLIQQVSARCPPSTPIPSRSWLSLQFWPKSAHNHSRIHYTGQFSVKYMVQARQFRKTHEDAHYAACIFRYQREMAVKFQHESLYVCMDDKHRVKVGEPSYPVAAAERGKKVLVSQNSSFEVADHDFCKFSLIPSVSLLVDIPTEVSSSWYSGQVLIGLKEGAYEQSSPLRHMTELHGAMGKYNLLARKSVVFVYTDGGPDHRLTYVSVKFSLISFFLQNDLDFLCACRTAPFQSWRNPAERVMSVVNLGLQCVGLMRQEMDEESEAIVQTCNSLSSLRAAANKSPQIVPAVLDSIEPVKILLHSIFRRLELHGQKFSMFTPASEEDKMQMWSVLKLVDPSLNYGDVYRKASLRALPRVVQFMEHCCQSRHYSFCIKKCGKPTCSICKPVRMPSEEFEKIHFLPDPTPSGNDHYSPFNDVYGTTTTEQHRPSLQVRGKQKTLPFSASVQHVKNVDIMVQCEECEMWRLLYCKRKLAARERQILQRALDNVTYTCGAQLQDLQLGEQFADVYARLIRCSEPIEKLYYSVGKYQSICIHCAAEEGLEEKEGSYPQCGNCSGKELILKRK